MRRTQVLAILMAACLVGALVSCKKQTPDEQKDAGAKPSGSAQKAEPTKAAGSMTYSFTLEDQDGHKVSLSDSAGTIIVLEWINPRCPYVVRHYELKTMTALAAKYKPKGVVWLAIDSSDYATNDAHRKWAEKYGVTCPILNDSSGQVGKAFGAKTTPHIFILDKSGKVVYNGAIDSNPTTRGPVTPETVNYVTAALDEILAGKPVAIPETKAYGCTVKYK